MFMKLFVKCVLSTETHHRLGVVILFSFSAALHFLLAKNYRVALAERIKYLSSLNIVVSACVTEDVIVVRTAKNAKL